MRTCTALVLLSLAACSGDKSNDAPQTDAPDSDSEPTTDTDPIPDTGDTDTDTDTGSTILADCSTPQPIDGAGGVITHASASLDVPPSALSGTVDLQLCMLATVPPSTPEFLVPLLWEVRPVDTAFAIPAELSLYNDGFADSTVVVRTPSGAWRPDLGAGTVDGVETTAPMWRADQAYVAQLPTLLPAPTARDTVDVLMVVDNSASMAPYQAELAANITALLGPLQASAVDWHVGVVTTDLDTATDSGRLRELGGERWAHAAMPDPEGWLDVVARPGASGSGVERGLGAAYLALEVVEPTFNNGFRRADGPLEVLILSNEPDQTQASLITAPEFDTWFDAQVTCRAQGNFQSIVTLAGVDRGTAYIERSEAHGGGASDIDASSYLVPIEELGRRAAGAGVSLRPTPDDTTIAVWQVPADGSEPVEVTDWTYDPVTGVLGVGPSVTTTDCSTVVASFVPL